MQERLCKLKLVVSHIVFSDDRKSLLVPIGTNSNSSRVKNKVYAIYG